ncbi:MAG: hypothetical protein FJZ04_02690, partial [Candidatus Moranbacteria bacterium]|nr:hypothetical protein [Candidatus Moranbacteria bacterium]
MKSYFPNLILLFLASVAVALLIRYTDIVNIGMGGYWEDGVAGVKKIFYGQIPHADLDAAQKQKAREEMAKNQIEEPLFCGSAFFPWLPGANWQYRLSDGSKQDLVNLGVPAPGENSYFLDGQLASSKEWTVRSLFRCMEGKLWLTDFGFWEIYALEKTVTTPCVTEKYDFSLPQNKDFSKGSAWTERGCLKHEKLDQSLKKVEVEWEENIEARW